MAVSNMHTAVSNPFKMSKALCRFGYDVKYIFTNGDLNESEEELRWLAEHKPDIKVIVKPLGTSVTLTKKTLDVDIAVCVNEEWFRKATKTKQVTTEYDQFDNDYASIERLIDQIEKVTEKENEV